MLLKLRRLLLEKAGFAVLGASSAEQALATIAEGDFDLLVIGCEVTSDARERLLRNCSKVPTVALYCGDTPEVSADAVCDCLDNPELLVNTIQSLLLNARAGDGAKAQGFTRIALERGIAVSVCSFCYRFVAYGSREADLRKSERAHVCPEMRAAKTKRPDDTSAARAGGA